MSDPQKGKIDPFLKQWADPNFSTLSWEDQQDARASLFLKNITGSPNWENAPDETKIQTLTEARKMYPPSFTDQRYDALRRNLEDSTEAISQGGGNKPALRLMYSAGTQMGMTGLVTRGVVNMAMALSNTVENAESRIGQFFGHTSTKADIFNKDVNENNMGTLMARAVGGDKDGVKLAQYFQGKYEKSVNPNIPLIGGSTPTQLLGSALGFGTDLLTTGGVGEILGAGIKGAQALSPIVKVGAKAAITGFQGLARGAVTGAVNTATPGRSPVEGAVDFANGVASTVKSAAVLWGAWAAQDLAFGMLGQGAAEGLKRTGAAWLRAIGNQGRAALPNVDDFKGMIKGEYSPEAADLQQRFLTGNASPEALAQVGPATRDYATSIKKTAEYTTEDLLNNPEAAFHFSMQRSMGGAPTPLGIAVIPDGVGTVRLRTGLGQKGVVLGEHLTLSEADMVAHRQWGPAKDEALSNHDAWVGKYEESGSPRAKHEALSYTFRLNALQDAFPHNRTVETQLGVLRGSMDRLAPEGAAKLPSQGAMLTYGEVGSLQGNGIGVAKIQAGLTPENMGAIEKSGSLVNTDKPTRFSTIAGGDYNGAIVYSNAAPEQVFQAAIARSQEAIKAGAMSAPEDLAYYKLRGEGFDAIKHDNGDVTALYPREQIKHVSDVVNKSSREYASPVESVPMEDVGRTAQLDRMLAKAKAAHGEDITMPGITKSWDKALKTQDGVTNLWYNDAQGGTHVVSEPIAKGPTTYSAPSMLTSDAQKADWLMEAAYREGNTQIQKLPGGDYVLLMKGQAPIRGDLGLVTDEFLVRSTTPAHLRASLQSEGMSVKVKGGDYRIVDAEGNTLGNGPSVESALRDAKYRPKLLDGRFGPKNVEVLPEGAKFEFSAQGIRGSLSDVYKYTNSFMDVAEEEGKVRHTSTADGHISQGHDGAHTVEIPEWGIREKFGSLQEAKDYLGGRYKEFDNLQRIANERGFAFNYDGKRGYTMSNATGTFSARSLDEMKAVFNKVPDPRWAPGGKFDAGVTLKDSRDATKLPVDVDPSHDSTGKFYDRGNLGKTISRLLSGISTGLAPARTTMARFATEFGGDVREASKSLFKTQESIKTATNQSLVDAYKAISLESNYRFSGDDLRVVEAVRQAKDAGLGQEGVDRVLEENGYREGNPKRSQIQDYADRLKSEFYSKVFERGGQNWDHFLQDFAQKKSAFQVSHPQEYKDMELGGPGGMTKLIERLYGGRVPDDMRFMSLHERIADVDHLLKEGNATVRAIRYAEMANRWTYSAENMKDFYTAIHGKDVPQAVTMFGSHFIDEALNASQHDILALMRALGNEGANATEGSRANLLSVLKGLAAAKIYGFRPSSAKTIIIHNYLLASGMLGTEAANAGFKISAEGGVEHLKDQFQKGVFSGRIPSIFDLATPGGEASWLGKVFNKLTQASSYFVQNGHILGRSATYDAASWLFDRNIKPWMDGGKVGDFNVKMHGVKGHYLDPGAFDQVKGLLDAGDYTGARHAYAQNMTDQIAFQFRPEDQGWALNKGLFAKMWGQLSVVPTQYASAITRMVSKGSFADRATSIGTFAKNTSAFYGASRLAGLSGASLLPWHVVTLRGGPLWQGAVNLTMQKPGQKLLQTAEGTLANVIPGIPQVVQAKQVVKDLSVGTAQGDWAAFLTATGDSVSPDIQRK